MLRFAKVATPDAFVGWVSVPASVPLLGFVPMATVTSSHLTPAGPASPDVCEIFTPTELSTRICSLSVSVGCSLKRVGGAVATFGVTAKALLVPVLPLSVAVTVRLVSALNAVTDPLATPAAQVPKLP